MTQSIRDKLQALAVKWKKKWELLASHGEYVEALAYQNRLREINNILATEPPAVTVRKGWIAKDSAGVAWYAAKPTPNADGDDFMWELSAHGICQLCDETGECITDPWPDHPNGGPECVMEVG